MDRSEIEEEAAREPASARSVRNWLLTGEALQLAIIIVAIIVSYVKQQSATEDNRAAIEAQGAIITQLHESLDQLRMNRAATPEAAIKLGVLEARLVNYENRMERMESKLDLILERQR